MEKPTDKFNYSANNYPRSLVGEEIVVDKNGGGKDFRQLYGRHGFDTDSVFVVTSDHKKPTGVRIVSFKDSSGNESTSNAHRFLLAPKA